MTRAAGETGAKATPTSPWGWRAVVGTLAGLFLGGVFLVAVWGKMIDPVAFAEVIEAEGLTFLVAAHPLALMALGLEAAIGFALILGVRRLYVLIPAALLVAFFLFLTGRAWYREAHGIVSELSSCGCFGNLVDRTPVEAFWQDALLLVPALALSFLGRPRGSPRFPPVRGTLVTLLALAVLVFAWFAPSLPLDDLATRLKAGMRAEELCLGSGDERICLTDPTIEPSLEHGEHVVVIAELDEAFGKIAAERVDELWEYEDEHGQSVWLLWAGLKGQEEDFNVKYRAPPFMYRNVPKALLRSMYRSLPRTFVVKDGVVTQVRAGFPPLAELAR